MAALLLAGAVWLALGLTWLYLVVRRRRKDRQQYHDVLMGRLEDIGRAEKEVTTAA